MGRNAVNESKLCVGYGVMVSRITVYGIGAPNAPREHCQVSFPTTYILPHAPAVANGGPIGFGPTPLH